MKLSVATVYYNSRTLQRTVASVFGSSTSEDFEYFVVDNASSDQSVLSQVGAAYPSIKITHNSSNVGFGRANNIALEKAKGEFILFLNPDVLVEPTTLEVCISYMKSHPNVGALSCQMTTEDGELLYSCRSWPTVAKMAARFFPRISYFQKKLAEYELHSLNHNQNQKVNWVSGGFLFCRTELVRELRGFDDRFFLYMEDVDLCRRISKTHDVIYLAETKVVHTTHYGSRKNRKLLKLHLTSMAKYFLKWGLK